MGKEKKQNMKKGILICAFATCGKSYLAKKYSNVIDLESSNYKYINNQTNTISVEERKGTTRQLNKEWPFNYYKAIEENLYKYDIILVQLEPEHFDYFDKHKIKYSIAYPNINNWLEVEKRCIKRKNGKDFIMKLKEVFLPYYEDALSRKYEKLYILDDNMTLEDCLIRDNIYLKSSPLNSEFSWGS